ncbi:alpha/beta hydrolase [Dyadobacter fanqingshengii]|uniref:Esterase family protein n=1 Tax=Dyadobacter fanqingshengii TaxID=2906443 RepID=A0A9X1P9X0_9BACT|nr:alpha/beta hydrolase-fold protein [Dyadobacter fanqingshengii]MCF0041401.1 esterase family protein [Dyadobacter fanqingshengii]USJ36878.1 esterase family protein [Dyadobacter fanqingshengii]
MNQIYRFLDFYTKNKHYRAQVGMLVMLFLTMSPSVYAQSSQQKAIIEDQIHYSAVFKENRHFRLILPPDYYAHPERRYPVIYYFHGNAGRFNGPAEGEVSRSGEARYYDEFNGIHERCGPDSLDNFASYVAGNDVIIAKWDGYVPAQYPRPYDIAPVKEDRQFVDYFPEFVQYIDAHYRTKAYREGRAVSGLSMGGFMSMLVASKYPHLLSSASFFCPSASFTVGPKALQIYTPFKEMGRNFVGLPIRMHLGSKDFLRQHDQEIDNAYKTLELNYESWHYGIGYFKGFHNAVNIKGQFDFHMHYFRMPLARPEKWHHIDLYPQFSVWNYHVTTDRNVPGFTLLNDVRKEGFGVQTKKWLPDGPSVPNLSVKIETDSVYTPSTVYELIRLDVPNRKISRSNVRSDKKGRIQWQGTGEDNDIGLYQNGDPGHITVASYSLDRKMPGVGDIVSLSPLLFNKGGADVDSIRIELIAQDEEVEVMDPAITIGEIAQGALHEKTAFRIRSRNVGLDRAKLKLMVSYNGKKDPFLLEVPFYSPEKTLAQLEIADNRPVMLEVEKKTWVGKGNGNGIANPGEWISIFTKSDLDSLHDFGLQLYTEDPYVDMDNRRMLFFARADWSGAQRLTSQVQIRADCPDGHEIAFYGIYEYPKNGNTRRDNHGAHSFIHETKRVSFIVKVKR